jgi:outer membrane protein assembly factor BamB
MRESKIIYIGIKGAVIALDAASGNQLWVAQLKGAGFVNVVVEGDKILATTHGEAFCFNRHTGNALWHNPLKGFGYGLASIATERGAQSDVTLLAAEQAQRDSQTAAAGAGAPAAAAAS